VCHIAGETGLLEGHGNIITRLKSKDAIQVVSNAALCCSEDIKLDLGLLKLPDLELQLATIEQWLITTVPPPHRGVMGRNSQWCFKPANS